MHTMSYIYTMLIITSLLIVIIQDGCTALHLAALGGYSHCMKFLLDKGADVHMTNKVQKTLPIEYVYM